MIIDATLKLFLNSYTRIRMVCSSVAVLKHGHTGYYIITFPLKI